jgi:glutamine synthetase adenylyltransferase
MVTDGYEARSGSAWFGRTLDALSRRQPSLAALLPAMVERPLDEAAVVACWERAVALSSAAGASAVGGGPAVDPGPALRRARQLLVLAIVERDVRQRAPLAEVCGAISAWGRLSTRIALHHAAAELAAQHGRPLDGDARGGVEQHDSTVLQLAHRQPRLPHRAPLAPGRALERAAEAP